jgi:SAM-dependent methyltransferase
MTAVRITEADQPALWNGPGGEGWAKAQDMLDRLFAPIERLLVDSVRAQGARRVLDIGCGTGATTRAIARLPGRSSLGVDISEPMLGLARWEAEREDLPAGFVRADAQRHGFEPRSFDMIVSRFGVMFFDDPVAAFANLRRAARPGARLRMIVWRGPEQNPFMTTAERAAAPFLPSLAARRPDQPGQFGFADRSRVSRILEESGWSAVHVDAIDFPCALPERELERYFTLLGPLGRALSGVDEEARGRIVDAVRAAFEPFLCEDEVRFTAACWSIGAQSSAARFQP